MQEYLYKHKKVILIVLGSLFLVLVGVGIFNLVWNGIYSAEVNIVVAPSIAKVKIGEDIYDSHGEYRLKPGEYTVEISAEGFYTKNGRLVAVGGDSVSLAVFLEPEEGNEDWYNTHPGDNLIRGEVKNTETVTALRKLGEEYPILNKLPYDVEYFTNDYSSKVKYSMSYRIASNSIGFVIVIDDYMGGAKEAAYGWLRNNGADVDNLIIEYNDLSKEWR